MAARGLAVITRRNLRDLAFTSFLPALLLLYLLIHTPAQAQESKQAIPNDHSPKVCTNYNFNTNYWLGIETKPSLLPNKCPQNQVLLSVRASMKREIAFGPKYVHLSGNCCPLPAEDILLDETLMENEACPEDFVAVGAALDMRYTECESLDDLTGAALARQHTRCKRLLHETPSSIICQKINTERYQLSTPMAGITRAASAHLRDLFFEDFTRAKHIPLALRYGILRHGRTNMEYLNCVGYPWGSIVTGKQGKGCSKIQFRQLQFRGQGDDPPKGTPVVLYPECLRLDNPLAKKPRCITADDVDISADDL